MQKKTLVKFITCCCIFDSLNNPSIGQSQVFPVSGFEFDNELLHYTYQYLQSLCEAYVTDLA